VLRQEVVRRFPDPDDPDAEGATVRQYLDRLAAWPGCVDLRLLPESQARLEDPRQPTTFQDRYRMVGKLGEGGMGTVWETEDTLLARRCALKLLRGDFVRSPYAVRRFLREGKLLAQIDHPGVVKVFDAGLGPDQTPYLVMELVEGEDLELRLGRAGAFPVRTAVALLLHTLEALAEILWVDTGLVIVPSEVQDFRVLSTPRKLVVFGVVPGRTAADLRPFTASREVTECLVLRAPEEMAWPLDTLIVEEFFAQRRRLSAEAC
jgi:hypothetical protein